VKEADLQRAIIKALEAEGCYVVNVVVAGRAGTADLIVCKDGRFVALEVKAPTGRPTALQLHELDRVRTAGGEAAVVRTVAEAIASLSARSSP